MDVKTFRARTMREALSLVRQSLGPDAAVLHTREVPGGLLRRLLRKPAVEIRAAPPMALPHQLARHARAGKRARLKASDVHGVDLESFATTGARTPGFDELRAKRVVEDATGPSPTRRADAPPDPAPRSSKQTYLPESLFRVFTDLIEAEMQEALARQLMERLLNDIPTADTTDPTVVKARLARMLEEEIRVTGPIHTVPGRRRLVALIGPTGVGKTTTIAKLAAHFRLKERKRVGLITVDTFRIAAVEQLRAYADIIDLPMEVVSNPAEMRHAVSRLSDLDLTLMDTAGRSPRDEVKLQELKALCAEAAPDEVHLVLSATCGAANLVRLAERFADVGPTALLLTKLDEAHGLGNLLPLVQSCQLPLSYLTNGQNVPDDIEVADAMRLSRWMIGVEQ